MRTLWVHWPPAVGPVRVVVEDDAAATTAEAVLKAAAAAQAARDGDEAMLADATAHTLWATADVAGACARALVCPSVKVSPPPLYAVARGV
jgi:hypothetical protein